MTIFILFLSTSPINYWVSPPASQSKSVPSLSPIPTSPNFHHTPISFLSITPPTILSIQTPLCRVSYDVIAVEYPNQPILTLHKSSHQISHHSTE
ncbi:hypothetical protein K440DRAFT_313120 [Wilcoxina mikolae CBS 423.85]|nr:hypothetical protein K440DRAFT_313120 [Wilcoxina mikolae CBS 423.85]